MKSPLVIFGFLAAFLLVGTLDRQWDLQRRGLSNPPTQAPQSARPGTNADSVRPLPASAGLSMPCTWICKRGNCNDPHNRRCVRADLRAKE